MRLRKGAKADKRGGGWGDDGAVAALHVERKRLAAVLWLQLRFQALVGGRLGRKWYQHFDVAVRLVYWAGSLSQVESTISAQQPFRIGLWKQCV